MFKRFAILALLLASTGLVLAQSTTTFTSFINSSPTASAPGGSDVFPIIQGGLTKKLPATALPYLGQSNTFTSVNNFTGSLQVNGTQMLIGTTIQAYNANLAAIAGLTSAADTVPYFTGSGDAALTSFTSFGRTLVGGANAAAVKTSLALNNVENTALSTWAGSTNLTTLGTIGTGTWNGTIIGLAKGGTNANLSATGGTSQVLKQVSTGAAITVARLACADLSDASAFCNGTAATSLTGTIAAARMPALTGDVTTTVGTVATVLATVNANTGSFGSSTAIPNFTVNGKGLITAAGTSVVIAPAGTLSGTTLNSTVVTSSLTSVGTLTGGATGAGFTVALGTSTVTGILSAANGGTGNGFTAFTGPTTSTKTFTLPNASSTILTSNAAVTVAQGGTGQTSAGVAAVTAICAATGTPSSSTFLRGDCAWATPAGAGNVSGPGSSVSGNLSSFNGTSGTVIQDAGIATSDVVTLTGSQTLTNKTLGAVTITGAITNNQTGGSPPARVTANSFALSVSGAAAASELLSFGNQTSYIGRRADGVVGSPTAIQSGENIATFLANGYDGSAYGNNGAIRISALNTWTTGDHSTQIGIDLTPSGSTTQTGNVLVLNTNGMTVPAINVTGSTAPSNGIYLPSANTLSLVSNGTGKWTLSSGGTLFGAATANTPAILDISATATVPNISPNRADVTTGFGGASGTISAIVGNVEQGRWTSTGLNNVNIGTTTPGQATFSSGSGVSFKAVSMTDPTSVSHAYAGNFSDSLYMSAGGYFATSWQYDSAGTRSVAMMNLTSANGQSTINFSTASTVGSAPVGVLTLSGQLTSCTGIVTNGSQVASCAVSDRRVKNDEGVITPTAALAKVLALPDLHKFQFKPVDPARPKAGGFGPTGDHYGWFAQDIQKVSPELIHRGPKSKLTPDGILQFDKSEVAPFALAAIKAQQAEIKALIATNAALTARVARLERKGAR